tara:strand:+ start:2774 stop:3085 length:312 start_codon:yes stop_codon:yes gene_type:complete
MSIKLLRQFIREQVGTGDLLGARQSFKTKDTGPFTYEDFEGYDIDIVANVHGQYSLTVKHNGENISPSSMFKDYAEANHHARMIVDKHRVGKVEPSVKKKEVY